MAGGLGQIEQNSTSHVIVCIHWLFFFFFNFVVLGVFLYFLWRKSNFRIGSGGLSKLWVWCQGFCSGLELFTESSPRICCSWKVVMPMSINPFWQYEQNWKQNLSATYGIRRSCFIALTPKWYTGCVWLLPSDLSTPEIFWFLVSLPSAFGSLPCLAQTCPCNVKSTSCIDLSVSELGPRPPTRPRILLKAPTLAEMEEMNISEVSWNSVILKGNRKVGSVLFLTAAHALFPNLSGLRFLSEEENETVTGKNRFLFCTKTQQLGKFFLSLFLLLLCYIKH